MNQTQQPETADSLALTSLRQALVDVEEKLRRAERPTEVILQRASADAEEKLRTARGSAKAMLERAVVDAGRTLRVADSRAQAKLKQSDNDAAQKFRLAEDRAEVTLQRALIEAGQKLRLAEVSAEAVLRERNKMQQQLVISDRMASMGTLAAGVAHEINNPLACVMGNLELAIAGLLKRSGKLGLQTEFVETLDQLHEAHEGAERIRRIVRDLRVFSRSEDEKVGAVDVQGVLESTLRLASNEIRLRARLVECYSHTPLARASEFRLGQALLNLIVNAAQSIPEGRAEHNEIRVSTSTDHSGGVLIQITDTGSGMTPAVLHQLFTPFFTTKPVDIGTGLGLSICHRIIAGFGGSIQVESEVGTGTTFKVLLAAAETEAPIIPLTSSEERTAPRRGRILVVDDEPMIVTLVQRILATEHEVLTTTSAAEALKQIVNGEQFDVILCDLMMPQMTGMDLHAKLSEVSPEHAARMIFLSGGAISIRTREFLDATPHPRLGKPFSAERLRTLVNDAVEYRNSSRPPSFKN